MIVTLNLQLILSSTLSPFHKGDTYSNVSSTDTELGNTNSISTEILFGNGSHHSNDNFQINTRGNDLIL